MTTLKSRAIVKVRKVAGSMVIGITKPILKEFQVKEGESVMVSVEGDHLVVTREPW